MDEFTSYIDGLLNEGFERKMAIAIDEGRARIINFIQGLDDEQFEMLIRLTSGGVNEVNQLQGALMYEQYNRSLRIPDDTPVDG